MARARTVWPSATPARVAVSKHEKGWNGLRFRPVRATAAFRNARSNAASKGFRHRAHVSDAVHRAQDLIDARFADRLALSDLAAAIGLSERTLTRRFAASTGLTPLRYQQELSRR